MTDPVARSMVKAVLNSILSQVGGSLRKGIEVRRGVRGTVNSYTVVGSSRWRGMQIPALNRETLFH